MSKYLRQITNQINLGSNGKITAVFAIICGEQASKEFYSNIAFINGDCAATAINEEYLATAAHYFQDRGTKSTTTPRLTNGAAVFFNPKRDVDGDKCYTENKGLLKQVSKILLRIDPSVGVLTVEYGGNISRGDSGGHLFNQLGEIVAVLNSGWGSCVNNSFAT
ncbi:hypothetical protein CONCODRAFT_3432 [Conidiobolus coronatus NRRL 28638]|uniref:Peptidase S1 domain-containing protein n=1 Tax=Conidiobolus coronatus (strain ATCC 28846 / CBS 209.66 / NRRL 28638) TaxID=796925 RepID=A0A137PF73_CONC2|nr:hypothetical protein CONCODRAFT_3432 [Conidiobolus coronatus NRRL 28638]|eukprot:KXN73615.1 hypothetical protein CONCODRAFT_3432 [Conidiobolus coronatus NRRL 28638]